VIFTLLIVRERDSKNFNDYQKDAFAHEVAKIILQTVNFVLNNGNGAAAALGIPVLGN